MKKDDESQQQTKSASANPSSPGSKLEALEEKLRWAQESQALAVRILNLLNRQTAGVDAIREILGMVKGFTGFEAVGIRLRDGDDYPYFETQGFPGHFVDAENSLCARNEEGEIIRNSAGYPIMECMCGNILQGRTDPSLSFFTQGGSFWTNCTTELLATTSEEERQSRTRDRCNGEGYESVALVPLRSDREIIGLFQLNDSRKNCFTRDMIEFFEGIGASIGIVLSHKRVEQERERLFNLSIDMLGIAGFDGFYKQVNPAFTKSLGWTKEEFLSKPWIEFVHPEDQEETITALERLKSGEPLYQFRNRCQHKDGTYRWISWDSFSISDENMIFAVARDVTKRKQMEKALRQARDEFEIRVQERTADLTTLNEKLHLEIGERKVIEEALRASEKRYRELVEKANDIIYRTDANGFFILFNPVGLRVTGYSQEEITRKHYLDLIHPNYKEQVERFYGLQFVKRIPDTYYEVPIITKQRKTVWIGQRVQLVTEGEAVVGFQSICRDITERKNAEEALRESEQRFRAVVDNVEVGISVLNPDMQIVEVNKTFKKYFPHVRPASGQICYEEYNDPPRSEPCSYCPSVLTLKDGKVHEAITDTPTGSEIKHYHLISSPIKDSKGQVQYVIELTEDVTERKHAEELLRQAERRYRRLFEDAPLMYVITRNKQGVPFITNCNGPFLKSLGYSREEAVGQPLTAFYSPTSITDLLEGGGYARALAGEFLIGERQLLRRDGSLVPTLLYTAPEVDPSGRVIGTCAMYVDITEQKKAEEALLRSQAQLSNALTMAHLGHWEYDVTEDLFTFNDHFYKIFRTTAEQVGGYTMSSADYARRFVHPDEISVVANEIRKAIETTDPNFSGQLEHRMLYADGEIGYITVRFFAVKDELGHTVKTYGVNQDITERVQMETLLRESERWNRTLVEESFDGMFLYEGPKILFANGRLHKMLGYAQGELEGMDHDLLCHPDYQHLVRERASARLRGEEVTPQCEVLFQRKDGSTFDVEVRVKQIKMMGAPVVQVWIRDISDRKRSEQSQRRLATAVEQAAEAVVVTDISGRIQYVNPAFERITGYTSEEIIGQNPRLLNSGEHDRKFYRNLWDTIKRGEVWAGRFINKRKDGSLYHEDATISPVRDPDGQIMNFVAVKRDITQQLELSRQLLQAQKMEAIGTLAGGIAHDFNNLLQVTLGYSELLLAEKSGDDPEYADLSKIFQAAKSGAELVQRLLTFSRKVELKPIPLDLNRQIIQVEKILRRTIPKMIDIQIDLSDDLAKIHADPTQMEQVLMNLAVNARDAMPDKGTLTLRTANITLDQEYCMSHAEAKPGEYVLLTVSDTGHGMDKATIGHIFEPFYTTKELGRGTGLGLAMVYGIVKQHDGHITCYSEVGHGTTFTIYFPAIETQIETDIQTSGEFLALGTERILLVDDEEFVRDLGARILSRAGYKVLTAANGKEALVLFEKEGTGISLVLLDLIMPKMGGTECLKELRKIDPDVKVLIASGLSADPSMRESAEPGAKGFVSKPFRMKELLRQVRKVLDAG